MTAHILGPIRLKAMVKLRLSTLTTLKEKEPPQRTAQKCGKSLRGKIASRCYLWTRVV